MVWRDGGIDDVAIAVWRAGGHLLRVGLRGAQGHAQPDRAVQLELIGLARRVRVGRRGVAGQLYRVGHVIARPRRIGVENRGWFVVTDVLAAEDIGRVGDFGTRTVCAVNRRVRTRGSG